MSELSESLQNAANFAQSDYMGWDDGAEVMSEAKARIEILEAENAGLRRMLRKSEALLKKAVALLRLHVCLDDVGGDERATLTELTGGD